MDRRKMKGRVPIVPGDHPAVVFLDEQLVVQNRPAYRVALAAGLSINVISLWRRGGTPSVGNLDAVLQVLGYRLAVVPL